MKKLAKQIDKFADVRMIKLNKWLRNLLYEFLIDLIEEILESFKNETKDT